MRILIADDHAMLREGLKQILAEHFPSARFGESGTTQQTLEQLQKGAWDVLVLDFFMPGRGGLEVLQEVRAHHALLPVLVISVASEDQLALRVLQAGASGYLTKTAAPESLVEAIKKITSGGRYVSAKFTDTLLAAFAKPFTEPHQQLSDREFQVLQMLGAGKSVKEIAGQLSLSPKTISNFRAGLLEKLQLQNDVQLLHYAQQHQLAVPFPYVSS